MLAINHDKAAVQVQWMPWTLWNEGSQPHKKLFKWQDQLQVAAFVASMSVHGTNSYRIKREINTADAQPMHGLPVTMRDGDRLVLSFRERK